MKFLKRILKWYLDGYPLQDRLEIYEKALADLMELESLYGFRSYTYHYTGICYFLRKYLPESDYYKKIHDWPKQSALLINTDIDTNRSFVPGYTSRELMNFFPELKMVKPWYVGFFKPYGSYWWEFGDMNIRISMLRKMIYLVKKKMDKESLLAKKMINKIQK